MMPFGLVGFARLNALLFSLFQMCQAVRLSALLELMLKQLGCKKIIKKKPKFKAICYRDLKQDGYFTPSIDLLNKTPQS